MPPTLAGNYRLRPARSLFEMGPKRTVSSSKSDGAFGQGQKTEKMVRAGLYALSLRTTSGRAMAGLLALFAEFEHDIPRKRVRAGLAHARQNGNRLGQAADGVPEV
jgi:Resolvase, N terminal domain